MINDGSTDETASILRELRELLGTRLEILDRENRGHGQSCLEGHRMAAEREIPFVLQVDSDGQCDPQYFSDSGDCGQNTGLLTERELSGMMAGGEPWPASF